MPPTAVLRLTGLVQWRRVGSLGPTPAQFIFNRRGAPGSVQSSVFALKHHIFPRRSRIACCLDTTAPRTVAMADAVVETVPAEAPVTKDLKEKKEVVEEPAKAENGSGDAPANGTEENGADHAEEKAKDAEKPKEKVKEAECPKEKSEDKEAEEKDDGEGEEDGDKEDHPVKRAAEEEEKVETKKQKTENGDSTEVEASA